MGIARTRIQFLGFLINSAFRFRLVFLFLVRPGDDVIVTSSSGLFHASQVIVTVPLQVLQRNAITFSPGLSPERLLAVEKIRMEPAIKVCCRLRRVIWPADAGVVYTGEGFLSQYWFCVRTSDDNPAKNCCSEEKPSSTETTSGCNHSLTSEEFVIFGEGNKTEHATRRRKSDCFLPEKRADPVPACREDGIAAAESDLPDSHDGTMVFVGRHQVTGESASAPWTDDELHQCVLLFGFATAEVAEAAVALTPELIVKNMLEHVDVVFA